jgi:hypothetical protein
MRHLCSEYFLIYHRATEGTEEKIIFAYGEKAMGMKIPGS